jgi:DNA-binding LacI/PurR family transcriptional regulator
MTPNQIRGILQLKEIQQVDIAKKAGVHRALVSQVIDGYTGKKKHTKAKAQAIKKAIAQEIGLEPDQIFNGQESNQQELSNIFLNSTA